MKTFKIRTRLKEASSTPNNGSKFQVLLIQEGLGNLKDCFYYTKQALQNASPVFEGKKCYADHPSSIEENVRPERSTRDILGYYQDVQYSESADGRGQLVANLITVVDPNLSWAQALLSNSIQYAQSYPNADFVGLSINASGEADEIPLTQFLQQNEIPNSVMPKLQEAQAQGIDTLRVVSALKDALSCDLVTDAGAGGRILKMIEQEKRPMAKKESKEKEHKEDMESKETGINPKDNISEAGEEGEGTMPPGAGNSPMANPTGGGQPDHADAAQDTALFQQLIQQYLGGDEGVDPNEAMQMAKHAHEAAMEAGMSHEEAMEAAGNHLKMSAAVGKKMSQCKQAESEEHHEAFPPAAKPAPSASAPPSSAPAHTMPPAAPAHVPPPATEQMPKKQVEKYYESMRRDIVRLNGENARLRENAKKHELSDYLEKKMKESKLPVHFTKAFRESIGTVRSKADIDQYWKVFTAGEKAQSLNQTEAVSEGWDSCLMTEKHSFRESHSIESAEGGFEDCLI